MDASDEERQNASAVRSITGSFQAAYLLLLEYERISLLMLRLELNQGTIPELLRFYERQEMLSRQIQDILDQCQSDMSEEMKLLGDRCIDLQLQIREKIAVVKAELQETMIGFHKSLSMLSAYHKSYTAPNGFFIDKNK